MSVIHTFKKRPSKKNLANRTVSFAASGEIDHVRDNDIVLIEISTGTYNNTKVQVSGKKFNSSVYERSTKDGTKVKVFKF